MTTRQELEQAIAVLETHRDILEDDVVEAAVAALREKLIAAQSAIPRDPHKNITVLVADLSGFTAMSELMDAEEVRDTINAVWQKLDGVITAWGGHIDQHVGDGIVALYHVTSNLADCIERAVLTGLDMHKELALFSQNGKISNTNNLPLANSAPNFRMRIGIHTGPVLFGQVGSKAQITAMGETVAVANQLERAAPIGSILVSKNVYHQIQNNFDVESLPSLILPETNEHFPVYVVHREKQHAFQDVNREIIPGEPRFIGRTNDIERLQLTFDIVQESGTLQVLTILGEAGIGKSRLRIEFEKLLALQPEPIHIFKGTVQERPKNAPCSLLKSLMTNYCDIHLHSSARVAKAKLIEKIVAVLEDDDVHAIERAHFIGYLLGFGFSDSPYLKSKLGDPRRIRDYGFQDLAKFFTSVAQDGPVVMLLENMELTDEGSLDFLDYLAQTCSDLPIFIVYLARPVFRERWPSFQLQLTVNPLTYKQLELKPLTSIDSRHLIADRLVNIPRPPVRLTDLIAESAQGNPFTIVELVEMLGDVGVIIKGSKQWRVQMTQLKGVRGRLSLDWLLAKLFERLTAVEQAAIQFAAVIGDSFWDTAVVDLVRQANQSFSVHQILAALTTLEHQELISKQPLSHFADAHEFQFRPGPLRSVIYEGQPAAQRQAVHTSYAAWFKSHRGAEPANDFSIIAYHLEQAGSLIEAADWYGRAAIEARENCAPETAVRYFQQALDLLPNTADHIPLRIKFNQQLSEILRRLARFEEEISLSLETKELATATKDTPVILATLNDLTILHNIQGDYVTALETAEQAEQLARSQNSSNVLAAALTGKGWALLNQGDIPQAIELGEHALTISAQVGAEREMAFSYTLLGMSSRLKRQFDEALAASEKALALFREIGLPFWEGLLLGNLGFIAFNQHKYQKAAKYFKESLQIARSLGDYFLIIRNLRELSKLAWQQNQFTTAESHSQQAVIWAEKSGNLHFRVLTATDLGRLYLAQNEALDTAVPDEDQLFKARTWLHRIWEAIKNDGHPLYQVMVQTEIARLLLAEQNPVKALREIRAAIHLVERDKFELKSIMDQKIRAAAWRELGNIAAALPKDNLPLLVDNQLHDPGTCFQKSLEILFELKFDAQLETARTLFAWSVYELRWGNHQRGEAMWQKAQAVYTQLGMTEEVAKMEHYAL